MVLSATLVLLGIVAVAVLAFALMNAREMYMSENAIPDGKIIAEEAEENESESASESSISSSEDYPPLEAQDKQRVEAYLGSHINEYAITPTSVLDGSFYVTSIEWYTENAVVMTYSDGNKTIKARATATVNGNDVRIVNFNEFQVTE